MGVSKKKGGTRGGGGGWGNERDACPLTPISYGLILTWGKQ